MTTPSMVNEVIPIPSILLYILYGFGGAVNYAPVDERIYLGLKTGYRSGKSYFKQHIPLLIGDLLKYGMLI